MLWKMSDANFEWQRCNSYRDASWLIGKSHKESGSGYGWEEGMQQHRNAFFRWKFGYSHHCISCSVVIQNLHQTFFKTCTTLEDFLNSNSQMINRGSHLKQTFSIVKTQIFSNAALSESVSVAIRSLFKKFREKIATPRIPKYLIWNTLIYKFW